MGFFDALKKFFLGEEEPEKKEETTTESVAAMASGTAYSLYLLYEG